MCIFCGEQFNLHVLVGFENAGMDTLNVKWSHRPIVHKINIKSSNWYTVKLRKISSNMIIKTTVIIQTFFHETTHLTSTIFTEVISHKKTVNIQTYKHTNIQTYKHTNIQTYKHTNLQTYTHTNIQTYKLTNIQTYKHTNIQTYKHTNIQTYKLTNAFTCIHINRLYRN